MGQNIFHPDTFDRLIRPEAMAGQGDAARLVARLGQHRNQRLKLPGRAKDTMKQQHAGGHPNLLFTERRTLCQKFSAVAPSSKGVATRL
jgi:hypothetical protein